MRIDSIRTSIPSPYHDQKLDSRQAEQCVYHIINGVERRNGQDVYVKRNVGDHPKHQTQSLVFHALVDKVYTQRDGVDCRQESSYATKLRFRDHIIFHSAVLSLSCFNPICIVSDLERHSQLALRSVLKHKLHACISTA